MIFPLELKNMIGEDRIMFKLKTRELWNYFTTYEKWWFFSILFLAIVFAILFPEEDINGVNGWIIATLYLLNIFLNILCELLISKQSKWNFIVSLGVELTEILIPLLLLFRFATLSVTLLFWIPIDIISFINWHKHPDQKEEELTKVRKLSGWAEVGVILAIIVWTVVVGTLMSKINIRTELFGGNRDLETWVNYLDALVSAVGMANGIFILLRLREQWIAWILDSIIEAIINILSGQYILLILKAGYLTNSIYGYIKWTKYIKEHKGEKPDKSLL